MHICTYGGERVKYQNNWSNIHNRRIVYSLDLVIILIHFKLGYINTDKLMKMIYFTTQVSSWYMTPCKFSKLRLILEFSDFFNSLG